MVRIVQSCAVLFAISFAAAVGVTGCTSQTTSADIAATAAIAAPAPAQPPTNLRFVDITANAGIDYRWTVAGTRPLNILQSIGNGCALLDYDNDGNLDVLLVGPRVAMYRGDGHGHFTDVSEKLGLTKLKGNFLGCAVGDYDNDGYEDIYLSAYRGGVLLHNDHGKRFVDVTAQSGMQPQPWGTSCAFADIDGSGRLSLYVGNYIDFGPQTWPQLCEFKGMLTGCAPGQYRPIRGVLYRNLGAGKFADVTDAWGADRTAGRVLGAVFADYDGSGRQSCYLADDQTEGNLLHNTGHGFVDVASEAGVAVDAQGRAQNGMGADWGDYDNDGRLDLAVGTFRHQGKPIYHNDGGGVFSNESAALGLDQATLPNVAFGLKWLDVDNSGWLDLMIANGHVLDNADTLNSHMRYREATQLFQNEGGRKFVNAGSGLVGPAGRPIVGRGLAIGDFDNDGRMDALVVDAEGRPLLLHNETPHVGHWLEIELRGTRSNRDGIGALVTVKAAGLNLLRQCTTGGSYMSASSKRLHVGLGTATVAGLVQVRWPSGRVDRYHNVPADRMIHIAEGSSAVQ